MKPDRRRCRHRQATPGAFLPEYPCALCDPAAFLAWWRAARDAGDPAPGGYSDAMARGVRRFLELRGELLEQPDPRRALQLERDRILSTYRQVEAAAAALRGARAGAAAVGVAPELERASQAILGVLRSLDRHNRRIVGSLELDPATFALLDG